MENKTLLNLLERKHPLMIMLYLITWSPVANKVLLFQAKLTIFVNNHDATEDHNHNNPTDICKTPATDSIFTLWIRWKIIATKTGNWSS